MALNTLCRNHDFCHSYHKKSRTPEGHARWLKQYKDWGWIMLPEQSTFMLPEIGEVNLCHLPYANTEYEGDKYAKWRPYDNGNWLLCGHVHDKWKVNGKMLNVGVDVWDFKPVSVTDIVKAIQDHS
jgi:calcineurin-like phosphoesterase family protein